MTLMLGVLALAGFVTVEAHVAAPMLPMRLFRSRSFCGANLLTLLLYGALGGGLFFFPLNLIQVQGYSTTAAGAALLPFVVLMSVLSRWAGGLVGRYEGKMPLVIGPLVAGGGFVLFALPSVGDSYWVTFFPAVVVLGLGMAISVAPLTTTAMNSVDAKFAGAASGISNAASHLSALLAIALLGIVLAHVFNKTLDEQLKPVPLSPTLLHAIHAQRDQLAAIDSTHGRGGVQLARD
jgi:MFS family permease